MNFTDKPCADAGFTSYRYHGRFGWVMIGAVGTADALREAERSIDGPASIDRLQVWDGSKYVAVRPVVGPDPRD
jgi:hypothetical protein